MATSEVARSENRPFRLAGSRIFVAGHGGMVGAALCRRLADEECEIVTAPRSALDLRSQAEVQRFLQESKPDAVVVCAARVGGIEANRTRPAEFLFDNLAIETNLVHGAHLASVSRLLFLGSSCMFPRLAEQPISEDSLLQGPLEPTNEWVRRRKDRRSETVPSLSPAIRPRLYLCDTD